MNLIFPAVLFADALMGRVEGTEENVYRVIGATSYKPHHRVRTNIQMIICLQVLLFLLLPVIRMMILIQFNVMEEFGQQPRIV